MKMNKDLILGFGYVKGNCCYDNSFVATIAQVQKMYNLTEKDCEDLWNDCEVVISDDEAIYAM